MFNSISLRRGGTVSPSTRRTFMIYLERFFKFCEQDPDTLIAQRKEDWRSDDVFVRRTQEEKVMEFAQYLNEEGYSSNTISTAIGAVRSFYRTNYLPMTEINFPVGRPVRVYKIPTKEELIQALGKTNRGWHRAFMTLTKDSGISLQDMLALKTTDGDAKYGSSADQVKNGSVPIVVTIEREKTRFKYTSFFGEDSYKELANEFIFPDLKYGSGEDKRLMPYTGSTIREVMRTIGQGFGWESFCPYSLRKWFRTELALDDCNDALIESWMGHSLGRVRGAYFLPPVERQREAYLKHYKALKLN